MRPLEGVRVLDLSRLLPGPFCTLVLSDLGASVDKVEDPHVGDYMRLFPPLVDVKARGQSIPMSGRFAAINRDKRSLCLDLKQPAGREALLKLLPRYDILVESFRQKCHVLVRSLNTVKRRLGFVAHYSAFPTACLCGWPT